MSNSLANGKSRKSNPARAFGYQSGVRVQGTPLVCNAPRTAGALAFISHADVVAARVGVRSPITAAQVLLTQTCANLLQAAGHDLGSRALVANYGRPFVLGLLRVELFPSGVAPGSASLLCESPKGHVVFAGPLGLDQPGAQVLQAEIRPASALCIDATSAALEESFAPVNEAISAAVAFVKDALAASRQPVLLTGIDCLTLQLAQALQTAGILVRAHVSLFRLADVHRAAGLQSPTLHRFTSSLGLNEALLLPVQAKAPVTLARLKAPTVALTVGLPVSLADVKRLRPDAVIPIGNVANRKGLLSYVKATGAKEVATLNDPKGAFAALLRQEGLDAYALGPPAQMTLFAA